MALKDWKVFLSSKANKSIEFKNMKNYYNYPKPYSVQVYVSVIKNTRTNYWNVDVLSGYSDNMIHGGKIIIRKRFKTKSSALKFAKSYMRKH